MNTLSDSDKELLGSIRLDGLEKDLTVDPAYLGTYGETRHHGHESIVSSLVERLDATDRIATEKRAAVSALLNDIARDTLLENPDGDGATVISQLRTLQERQD